MTRTAYLTRLAVTSATSPVLQSMSTASPNEHERGTFTAADSPGSTVLTEQAPALKRKRTTTGAPSRGVANLTPEQARLNLQLKSVNTPLTANISLEAAC